MQKLASHCWHCIDICIRCQASGSAPRRNRYAWRATTASRERVRRSTRRTSDARYQARVRNCLGVPGGGALSVALVSRVSIDFRSEIFVQKLWSGFLARGGLCRAGSNLSRIFFIKFLRGRSRGVPNAASVRDLATASRVRRLGTPDRDEVESCTRLAALDLGQQAPEKGVLPGERRPGWLGAPSAQCFGRRAFLRPPALAGR